MTWVPFAHLSAWAMALSLALHLAVGCGVGLVYFQSVWRNARLFASGGSVTTTIALAVGRLVLLGAVLTFASLEGALPLLATAAAVLMTRPIVMRRAQKATP